MQFIFSKLRVNFFFISELRNSLEMWIFFLKPFQVRLWANLRFRAHSHAMLQFFFDLFFNLILLFLYLHINVFPFRVPLRGLNLFYKSRVFFFSVIIQIIIMNKQSKKFSELIEILFSKLQVNFNVILSRTLNIKGRIVISFWKVFLYFFRMLNPYFQIFSSVNNKDRAVNKPYNFWRGEKIFFIVFTQLGKNYF